MRNKVISGEKTGKMRQIVLMLRRFRLIPTIPILIIGIFVFCTVFAPLITSPEALNQSVKDRLISPVYLTGGSWEHPLGTDTLGRDLLTRIIYGGRVSLTVSLLAIFVAGIIGTLLGLMSGYFGGYVDSVIMRLVDAVISVPPLLIALLLAVVMGPGMITVVVAVSVTLWANYARIIRGEVLSIKERDFVTYAKISSCPTLIIMLRHLFPNVTSTLLVLLTLQVGRVILFESTLSFLGAGVPPPNPTWGYIVAEGRHYFNTHWWLSGQAGLAIMLIIMSFNLLGDWLRDVLDPKLRQV